MSTTASAAHDESPTPEGRFFGYPETLLGTTWTIREVCVFFGVSERKARDLLSDKDAPPRLRLGSDRCDRWNPYQVVAWAHHQDWRRLQWSGNDADATGDGDNAVAPGDRGRPSDAWDAATKSDPIPPTSTRAWRPSQPAPRRPR